MVKEGYIPRIEKDGMGRCIWNYFEVAVLGGKTDPTTVPRYSAILSRYLSPAVVTAKGPPYRSAVGGPLLGARLPEDCLH